MPEERTPIKIGVDDIVEAAGRGALRALEARGVPMAALPKSGVYIGFHIVCGLPPFINETLAAATAVNSGATVAGGTL
jgi:hypothetical protein